jgi:peptide/nickel transport system permease protein
MTVILEQPERPAVQLAEEHKFTRFRPGTVQFIIGATIACFWVLTAIFAPLIARFDPEQTTGNTLRHPGGTYWFGTDRLGFDIFARVIFSARLDLFVGGVATAVALTIGTAIGLFIGYRDTWLSIVLMRLFDALQAFPLLVLALVLVGAIGASRTSLIIAIIVVNAPLFVRVVRGEVLAIRERRFVEAAVATGNSTPRLLLRHIAPNVIAPITIQATIAVASSVMLIASLSFLGLGVAPPTPEWGSMISSGASDLSGGNWWSSVFPGIAILTLVYGFQCVGGGLRARASRRTS